MAIFVTSNYQQTNDKNENNMTENKEHFYMPITDVFYISGHGYVLVGYIESGEVNKGDEVVLSNGMKSKVGGIESDRKLLDSASKGDCIGLLLPDFKKGELKDMEDLVVEKDDGIPYTPQDQIVPDEGHFVMPVNEPEDDNIYTIQGKGYILIGHIESGTVHVGDIVRLNNGMKSFVEFIQIAGDNEELISVKWATKGEGCGLTLGSLNKGDLNDVQQIVVEADENPNTDFQMSVQGKQYIKGKGVVIMGKVEQGTIAIGDPVIVAKIIDGSIMKSSRVTAIEINGNNAESATVGQVISLIFKGLTARNNVDETIGTMVDYSNAD